MVFVEVTSEPRHPQELVRFMRIGFIGNTNNYPFMLALALRRLGHEVRFIVTSREPLSRPEHRYADIHFPYPAWIHDLSPIRLRDVMYPSSVARRRVVSLLRDCDAVFANDFGPMILPELMIPSIALLTGSDLYAFADPDTFLAGARKYDRLPSLLRTIARWILSKRLASPQRAGIAASAGVAYFPRGVLPRSDRLLEELGIGEDRRIFNAMADTDVLAYLPPRFNTPFRVFCGSRLNWASLMPDGAVAIDYKGAEIMVRGLAMFVRSTGVKLEIRLVKKGLHVAETVAFVEELGLKEHVVWLDEMSQKDVEWEYSQADVVFDQLGKGIIGMVCLDAMALGRPVIANGRPEMLEPLLGATSPICQASTPEEVSNQIGYLHFNPEKREQIGIASRKYVEDYCSSMALAKRCLERIAIHSQPRAQK